MQFRIRLIVGPSWRHQRIFGLPSVREVQAMDRVLQRRYLALHDLLVQPRVSVRDF
jgi:hypothetical protein